MVLHIVKICNRCGKVYDPYNMKNDNNEVNGIHFLNLGISQKYYSHDPLDYCLECRNTLKERINYKGGNENA